MIKDRYGQIAGNQAINAMIYRCFEELEDSDQLKFVKKFNQQLSDPEQVMHTFRELILGAYLHTLGFHVCYEQKFQDKTPDWVIKDDHAVPRAIVELVNLHIDQETAKGIQKQRLEKQGIASYWINENTNQGRLYHSLQKKALGYRDIVNRFGLALTIAVFVSFELELDTSEVMKGLEGEPGALFEQYPYTSGVLLFAENGGGYSFQYFENPASLRKMEIAAGVFSR